MKMHCLVVEDQLMFLELLLIALGRLPYIEVSATATSLEAAFREARKQKFDVVILDYSLPDGSGLDLANHLHQEQPDLEFIMLSAHAATFGPDALHQSHIRAVIDKVRTFEALMAELESLRQQRFPDLAGNGDDGYETLTTREREVFKLIGDGMLNKQIAARLFISVGTVETHRKSIARKLGVSGSELVRKSALYDHPFVP